MHITPKNWAEFQHYKDRDPTWIKLHKRLLDDYEFQCLPVASRALAPMLWLLASEHKSGLIDADHKKLGFRLRMTPEDVGCALKPLVEANFFEVVQDASSPLAEPERVASPEKEREKQVQTQEQAESAQERAATPKPRPRRSLPEDCPTAADQNWARQHWLEKGRADLCESLTDEIEKFRDHHRGKNSTSADWAGSWRTWARNAMNFTRRPNGNQNGNGKPPTAHDKFLSAGASLAREYLTPDGPGPGDGGDGPVEASRPLLSA